MTAHMPVPVEVRGRAWRSGRFIRPGAEDRRAPGAATCEGLWRSEKGSLYASDGKDFVCVSAFSDAFRGWVGKVAVRDVRRVGAGWAGWQAFRDPASGALGGWAEIELVVSRDRIVKLFPRSIPRHALVYGYLEAYRRVQAC